MLVPEHLGKDVLRRAGLAVPQGALASSPEEAARSAAELGGRVVLKALIPAGKRGKSGGILFADTPSQARAAAAQLIGKTIGGHHVGRLLVERAVPIERELYCAILNDPASASPLVLFSNEGGMDIEELNARAPEKIARHSVDIRHGLERAAAHELCGDDRIADVLVRLYEQFIALDCELLEINPLAMDTAGNPYLLDCKMNIDDSARPRQADFFALVERDAGPDGTALEQRARELGLYYIELEGDVGILANGAGLTMTTIDAVAHNGGNPANFLEIGGEAYTKATVALELMLSNPRVKSVLVNFCGAFARTDVMAEGVVAAYETLKPEIPFSFSIHGTGEERAIALVRERLGIEPHDVMDDAVRAAIAAARRAPEAAKT